ncbi:hypothetical protein HU200_063882 [Digitaria exilis]|uniref:H/ACA ribonucleoprotein complex subunit 2 n=1 Tax=Digitaria exilis TaxID=1010633 RepID=A0A835A2V8_9POAL|nr:hypothetical protein HU200_063882 [Digitaria exilis]
MGSDTEAENKRAPVALAPIAKPLAGKKLCKRTLKLVRRASEAKCLKRGVKEVVKSIRRGNKGLCVIAGNISPIDVITHVPILCEEANIPYVYVPSKELLLPCSLIPRVQITSDLATAGTTKRPTCCVLVMTKPAKGEIEGEVKEKLKTDYDQVMSDVAEVTSAMF